MEARYPVPEVTAQSQSQHHHQQHHHHHRFSPARPTLSHSAPLPLPLLPPSSSDIINDPLPSLPLTTTTTTNTNTAPTSPPTHPLSLPIPAFSNTTALHAPVSPLSSSARNHHHLAQNQPQPQQPPPPSSPPHHQRHRPHDSMPPVAIYDISKLHQAKCRVIQGKVYNGKGHTICGVLNQHDKPCHRIGRCPFHYYSSPVAPDNVCNGIVDASGTALPDRNYLTTASSDPSPPPAITPPKKVQYKHGWTKEEHFLFLQGLEVHGRGAWKQIASDVKTRTPTQVQSHAQKFYLRQKQTNKNKRSIHDHTLDSPEMAEIEKQMTLVGTRRSNPQPMLAADDFGAMFAPNPNLGHSTMNTITTTYGEKNDPSRFPIAFRSSTPAGRVNTWYASSAARSPLPTPAGWPQKHFSGASMPPEAHMHRPNERYEESRNSFPRASSHMDFHPQRPTSLLAGGAELPHQAFTQHYPHAGNTIPSQLQHQQQQPSHQQAHGIQNQHRLFGGNTEEGATSRGGESGGHFGALGETPNTSVYLNGEVGLQGNESVANMLSTGKGIMKPTHHQRGRTRGWQMRSKSELASLPEAGIGSTFDTLTSASGQFLGDIAESHGMDALGNGQTQGQQQQHHQGRGRFHSTNELPWKRS